MIRPAITDQTQRGSSLLIAMLALAAVGGTAVVATRVIRNMQVKADLDKLAAYHTSTEVDGAVFYHKLLGLDASGQPQALYIEPYLGNNRQIVQVGPLTSANWSLSQGVVTVTSPNIAAYTTSDLANLYGGSAGAAGSGVANSQSPMVRTQIKLERIDPPVSTSPYLIPGVVVSLTSQIPSNTDSATQAPTTYAHIGLPQPPHPTCRLTINGASSTLTTPLSFNDGDRVTVQVTARSVVANGWVTVPNNSLVPMDPGPNGAPTKANSITSTDVPMVTFTDTLLASNPTYDGTVQVYRGQVIGPNWADTCQGFVLVAAPPPPPPPPAAPPPPDPSSCLWSCQPTPEQEAHNELSDGLGPGDAGWSPREGPPYIHEPWYQWRFTGLPASYYVCFDTAYYAFDAANGCANVGIVGYRETEGCFDPQTKLAMADGHWQAISGVRVGDWVYNPLRHAPARVEKVIAGPELKPMLAVGYGGRVVKVTQDHPFVGRLGLIAAKDLRLGVDILAADGRWATIEHYAELPLDPDQQVWNLVLAASAADGAVEDHAVLADGILTGDLLLQQQLIAQHKQ